MKKEIWKDIPNYEGMYQVSNLGRVKSLNYKRTGKERVLKEKLNKKGYFNVNLYKDGKQKNHKIHRLVMLAFIGDSDLHVNHKNGIKTDNQLENLEYCTHYENMKHAYDMELLVKGEQNGQAKITRADAERIKYGHQDMTQRAIAEIYGIHHSHVHRIRSGKKWAHI